MFLKSLEIFGFKSFADRTHINFADGITALLGPNGCGKSNVVDAIKWVLAENRSKNLRAASMEDVIFNGTESRPALSLAEVTLTIANENSLLPISDTEIAIKRRLYRSGENEYFINGRPATATEIRKLFMDTGVGKAAYSVMEQGKITQILSSKPEDRRYLFEEAAGISRSKAEVAEAESKLEKTKANLEQINSGLQETKRSYETLKVQADKTTKYRALTEEKFNYELDIQLLKLKDFTQDKAHHEQILNEAKEKRDAAVKDIAEIYDTLNENTDKIKSLNDQLTAKQTETIKLQAEQSGKKDLVKQIKQQQIGIREKIGQLENRIKNTTERIDEYNQDIDSLNADLYEKKKALDKIIENINSFTQNISQCNGQIDDNQRQISTNSGKINNLDAERESLQKELAAITEDIVTELDAKLKEAGYSSSGSKKAKEALNTLLEKIKIFSTGRANIFMDFSKLSTHSEKDCERFSSDAVQAFTDLQGMLEELSSSIETYTKTTPQFIDDFLSPEGIITKKRNIDQSIQENLEQIKQLNLENKELANTNVELNKKISEYKETLNGLQINRAEIIQQNNNCTQQIASLKRNLASEENSLREQQDELFQENRRQEEMDDQLQEIEEQIAELQAKGDKLLDEIDELNKQINECNSKVSGKEDALKKRQDEKNKYQAQIERYTASVAQNDTEIRNVKQNFQDNYSRDLMEFEERMYTITETPQMLKEKLAATKQKISDLGSVNFMAVEQFAEEKERFERQQESYNDTKKTLENLIRVSEEIRTKSSELFLSTYNKIRKNFHNMFRRMFNGGGKAELRLIDPTNVLTTGIDIYAQPPGKKLENISLLSGGEKTMTAMALLFATYQVRPSPFCLLDEIDAALDDKNVGSLVNVLKAFSGVSQYIVITHNKKTVLGASTALGVVMEESGITKVVQIRFDDDMLNGKAQFEADDNFVEEDVAPEEGIVIPPRPPRREHNPDGSLKEPEIAEKSTENDIKYEENATNSAENISNVIDANENNVENKVGGDVSVEAEPENTGENE
ncbi:MAG: AAA family ATPase [Treponema sp.]|nr:AAA family ATPase [Treponema sp.]